MKAKELRDKLDWYSKTGHADDEVVVHCKEPSLGPVAAARVKQVGAGMDWDSGRIILEPEWPLLHFSLNRDTARPVLRVTYTYSFSAKIKSVLQCPVCEAKLRKGDRYCPQCGQRVDTTKYEDITLP